MMRHFDGLYILASLDGSPVTAHDVSVLGLPPDAGDHDITIVGRDRGSDACPERTHAFLGHVDDQPALAAALGLDRSTPPADLVFAAIARHGDAAVMHVRGEWSFAWWDADARALTLMASDTLRDPMFFATDGHRVAVAPDIRMLARLDGLGALDARGLLLSMGRAAIRSAITDETILRGVRRVVAGTCVRISSRRIEAGAPAPLPPPRPWRGSFAEATEALDAALREIVHAQMARHPRAAVMLSGGLDSSLLAAFAAAEKGPQGSLVAVTSAAPPGSALLDEVEFSRAVADQLAIPMVPVVPGERADVFRPSPATLRWMKQPICSPRHYLYEALYRVAADHGADAIFDGAYGEATLTGYWEEIMWHRRLRKAASQAARWARNRATPTVQDAFHVRLSAEALALVPAQLQDVWPAPERADRVWRRDDRWGYSSMVVENRRETTDTAHPGMRLLLPFRDRRLLTLFAGMPCRFLIEGGVTRAPGRALLAGKVPEHVRQRVRGRPFSPDYMQRIRRQAAAARDLLPDYRRAGAGDWIDLAWLGEMLSRIAAGARLPLDLAFAVQSTSCAAAFLAGWPSVASQS